MGILRWSRTTPTYQGFVASRARTILFSNTNATQAQGRSGHVAADNITSLKVAVSNYCVAGPLGAAATIFAAIEYPAGTCTRLLFSGATSVVVPDNQATFSDSLDISIPMNAVFWVRIFYTNPNGVMLNFSRQNTFFGEQCIEAVSGMSDQTLSGTALSGTSLNASLPPYAIVGPMRRPSVLITGDSRAFGYADVEDLSGLTASSCSGLIGTIARSLGDVPFVNTALPGQDVQTYLTGAAGDARGIVLPYGSQVIAPFGGVDTRDGRTLSQLTSDMLTLLDACGAPKKWVGTLEPQTTSTDSWATTANQTSFDPGRVAWNDAVRAGISGIDGYYEIADVIESARDSTFWATSGVTDDGQHCNLAGNVAVQNSGNVVPASYP